MTRRVLTAAILAVVVFCFSHTPAFAQNDPDVFVSTGPTSEILLGPEGETYAQLFTAKGGFKPEEMALAGDGKL